MKVEREEMKERMLNRVVVYPEGFSDNARSLCDGLLAKEVDKRMGFKNECCDEIRAHPFFSDINWRKLNAGSPSFSFHVIFFFKSYFVVYFYWFDLCIRFFPSTGILPPPFVPDPKVVYAKSLDDVGAFSSVKGVGLEDTDKSFFDEFSSGNIAIPWQEEMIDMGIYRELNLWGPEGGVPDDLRRESILEQPKSSTCCVS